MKVCILAGGRGTRLSEATTVRPKPMVEIGGRPMLWHIMSIYGAAGYDEFVIALGYLGEVIKEYFFHFHAISNDLSIDLSDGSTEIHRGGSFPAWKVHLVDTGDATMTGGRVKRLEPWLGDDETFLLTYGDGVADVDVADVVRFHQAHGRLATVTAVRPPARFGGLGLDGDIVATFAEKPQAGGGWINGGFMVLDRRVLDYIEGDEVVFEREPLERLTEERELVAYRHEGFWQPMDTIREKQLLDDMWMRGEAPWRTW
jgi:glucose-1-phosphate cytidylyltransferase